MAAKEVFSPIDTDSPQTITGPRSHFRDNLNPRRLKVNRRVELLDSDGCRDLPMLHRQDGFHDLRHGTGGLAVPKVGFDLNTELAR